MLNPPQNLFEPPHHRLIQWLIESMQEQNRKLGIESTQIRASAKVAQDSFQIATEQSQQISVIDEALAEMSTVAQGALESADGKNKIYYSDTEPGTVGELEVDLRSGDVWFDTANGNRMHIWTLGADIDPDTGEAVENNSWVAQQFGFSAIAEEVQTAIEAAELAAASKAQTYAQPSAPTGANAGDIWVDTDAQNEMYRFDGASWVSVRDGSIADAVSTASTALTTANSKSKIAMGATAPSSPTSGDMWIDTANGNVVKVWNGSSWANAQDAAIAASATAASSAQTTANGKNRIIRSATDASSPDLYQAGDQWWKYSGTEIVAMWLHTGSAWQAQTLTNSVITNLDAGTITAGTLNAARIGAGTITATKIAANTITANEMVAGTITAASGIIADAAITTAKIADAAVGTAKIENLAVTDAKIANLTVTAAKIADATITDAKIADATITSAKIANLDAGKITTGTLSADRIAAGAITGAKIAADAIDGKTITGATIRTAASGQRVQLDSDGLKTFDSSDVEKSRLSADSGGLLLTGPLTSYSGGNTQRAQFCSGGMYFDLPGSPGAATLRVGPGFIDASGAGSPLNIRHLSGGPNSDIALWTNSSNKIHLNPGDKVYENGAVMSPLGMISPYAGYAEPEGWLFCNGQSISRTTYWKLFDLLVPFVGDVTINISTRVYTVAGGHNLVNGDAIYFRSTGALPTGLSQNTRYYVRTVTSTTFTLSATRSETATGWVVGNDITLSGTQSGTHSIWLAPYGIGDGLNTFNVPNLSGKFPVGFTLNQSEFDSVAQYGGVKTTRHVSYAPPLNNGAFQDPGTNYHSSVEGDMNGYLTAGGSSTVAKRIAVRGVGGAIRSNGTAATEVSHWQYTAPNLPPYMALNFIIRAK